MGQCLAQTQLVSPGALGTCSHLGSRPVWTIQAPSDPDGVEQQRKDAKTTSHNYWWSWGSFTQGPAAASKSVGGVGPALLPSPAMALCDIDYWPVPPKLRGAVFPRAHLEVEIIPTSSLCLECCKTSSWHPHWDFTELTSPESTQPCSFSPSTLSQCPRDLGWASQHLKGQVFLGKCSIPVRGSSPHSGWGGLGSPAAPYLGSLLEPSPAKPPLCSPRVMALAEEMC